MKSAYPIKLESKSPPTLETSQWSSSSLCASALIPKLCYLDIQIKLTFIWKDDFVAQQQFSYFSNKHRQFLDGLLFRRDLTEGCHGCSLCPGYIWLLNLRLQLHLVLPTLLHTPCKARFILTVHHFYHSFSFL